MEGLFEEEVKTLLKEVCIKGQVFKYFCVDAYNGQIAKYVPLVNWNSDNAIVELFEEWVSGYLQRRFSTEVGASIQEQHTRQVSLIELGSGLGIPSIFIAKNYEFKKIVINDGDSESVNFIKKNVELNKPFKTSNIKIQEFMWISEGQDTPEVSQVPGVDEKYDLILGSDVIYDQAALKSLLWTIKSLLKKDGACLICNFYSRFNKNETVFWECIEKYGLFCRLDHLGEKKETVVAYIYHADQSTKPKFS